MINRREFVRFGAATLTTAVVPSALASADATGGNGRRLRIGILADGGTPYDGDPVWNPAQFTFGARSDGSHALLPFCQMAR